jgi:tetratricopeptide (TPR) repeat protein
MPGHYASRDQRPSRYREAVAARVLVLAVVVVLGGLGAIDLHDWNRCRGDERFIGRAEHNTDGDVDRLLADCSSSHDLALVANVLQAAGRTHQAIRIADEAIRREPQNFEGWLALSRTLHRRGLAAAARRAQDHVLALNPRFGRAPG